ncbi:MAG TPA: hypothetical protein VFE15_13820 [Marmoricola sp.]|nr:hypothetical protein [Marmoricola sp.]
MHARFPALRSTLIASATAALLVASLAGCGGSSDKASDGKTPSAAQSRLGTPSAPLTDTTVPCAKFSATAAKIADAEKDLYTGGAAGTLQALIAELDALKKGAPDDVQTALTDLGNGFKEAAADIKKPTASAQADLATIGQRLSQDSQAITSYVVKQCTQ